MRRLLLLVTLALAGCDGGDPPRSAAPAPTAQAAPAAEPEATPRPRVARARCPAALGGCREATGRVLYVEAVDPDGDGDAHFVLAGGRITAPGISAIAVRRELRPRRLPE